MDVQGPGPAFDHFSVNGDFLDPPEIRQLEHGVEQDALHDRAQAPGARLALDGLLGDRRQGVVGERERHVLHLEQALVLLEQGVLRLSQDLYEGFLVQVFQRRDDRQAADEFRNKPELYKVFWLAALKNLAGAPILRIDHRGVEADRGAAAAVGNQLVEAREGAAADEQHVGGVDLQEFLLWMLAAALRGYRGDCAFHDLQEGLLHALARHVAGDRGVVRLAADLVDLVDVDDAALGPLDVVV